MEETNPLSYELKSFTTAYKHVNYLERPATD